MITTLTTPPSEQIIIGIDPGTIVLGYGVLRSRGMQCELLAMGVLKLDKYKSHYDRLHKIHEGVTAIIDRYHPHHMAIEAPFYGKNVQSMLKLGRAQGAAIVAATLHQIPVTEYSPSTIKKAITGHGNAAKEQVATLLQGMLHIPAESMMTALDATDGVAAAVCHHIHCTGHNAVTTKQTWADYLRRNPGKVIK